MKEGDAVYVVFDDELFPLYVCLTFEDAESRAEMLRGDDNDTHIVKSSMWC